MKRGNSKEAEQGGILIKLIILLCFVVFCMVLYFARGPILRFVAESWMIEDVDGKADALIVLSDDNFYADRAQRAAELLREGKATLIVASARDGDFDPQHWWEKRKSIKELTREFAGMVVAIWELSGRRKTRETSQSVVNWEH